MRRAIPFIAGLAFLLLQPQSSPAADPPRAESRPTFWIVPHTHWEGAVFKTREEYLEMGLPNILKALKLLKEQPNYRFVLDQVAYVRPFLERYPDHEADFRRFLAEGRLQLAGALDVMPDVNMPGGETFVRQMQYGKGYYRDKLGVDVTVGWLLDTFGHHAQLPQLLTLGGYRSFWFCRGVPRPDHPSEFLWEGIDGTRIAAFYLPHNYGLMYGAPRDLEKFRAFVKQRFGRLDPNSHGNDRVGLAGVDVNEPEPQLAPMVEHYNAKGDGPIFLRMAMPTDFEAVVNRRTDRPVFRGELNPIFQGTYSSRIELKGWIRTLERKLVTAEKLAALGTWLGAPAHTAALWRAWEPVLFNETHDLTSGVMTDHVYADTVRSYEFSDRLADEQIAAGWNTLAAKVDTRGLGTPILVYNPLGWTRTDIATADVGFTEKGIKAIGLVDDAGAPVPAQLEREGRYEDGGLKTARVAFLARDVPALGHRVYHVVPKHSDEGPGQDAADSTNLIETPLYRVMFDLSTGAITSLRVKDGDREVFAGPAGVVARQEDRGDFWELYRGLDGASKLAMTTHEPVPARGKATFSDEFRDKLGTIRRGPVYSEFEVSHPLDSGSYATTVRVYRDLRRIDGQIRLVNQEKFVRYRALFPTTTKGGRNTHEIPFGAIERPSGIEFPAQNWVDHGDGNSGLAVLNVGLPGNVATDGTLMLSLLRAHSVGAYGFIGGHEPWMTSETGFQLGKERTMRYALVPHSGDWKEAGIYRDGLELNHPLLARVAAAHPGPLPARWGLLDVSAPGVVLASLKPARGGGIALRVYEAVGRPAKGVAIKLHVRVLSASEANLLEDPGSPIAVEDDAVRFDLHPYEIKTVILQLEPRNLVRG